jgi:hypothetical protein
MHTRRNSLRRDMTSEKPIVVVLVHRTMKSASILTFSIPVVAKSVDFASLEGLSVDFLVVGCVYIWMETEWKVEIHVKELSAWRRIY